MKKRNLVGATLFAISAILLAVNFYANVLKSANQTWFENHQMVDYGENLVVARLILAQKKGVFSKAGLGGRYSNTMSHHNFYTDNIELRGKQAHYMIYKSQIGGQGVMFAIIDKMTSFSNSTNIKQFRLFTSFLTAIAFSLIVLWFYLNFGLGCALFVLITTLFSQWITVFGRNIFWSLWAFYLPFVTTLFLLYLEEKGVSISGKLFQIILFLSVFLKCFYTGYEYITTALVMMLVPFVYYGVYSDWDLKNWVTRVLRTSVTAIVAVLSTLVILIYQISSTFGKLEVGFRHIINSFLKRTYGNPDDFPKMFRASLESNIFDVIAKYWNGMVFFEKVSYGELILVFMFFSALVFISRSYSKKLASFRKRNIALVVTTWFSILAPLSWFVVFKGHSDLHAHMNFITWHMPFTLFGFGVVGAVLTCLVKDRLENRP